MHSGIALSFESVSILVTRVVRDLRDLGGRLVDGGFALSFRSARLTAI